MYKRFASRQLCRARLDDGPTKAVDYYLTCNSTCVAAASLLELTSSHPMRNQANPLFAFILNKGLYLNW